MHSKFERKAVVGEGGTINLEDIPIEPGQVVRVVVYAESLEVGRAAYGVAPRGTVQAIIDSGALGVWADREDIADGATFARQLRESSWSREYRADDTN